MKKYIWSIIKFIAFLGCIVISTTLGLIPTAIIMGITAIKPIAIGVSIALGFIAIPWNNIRNKIVDWVFKRKENKFNKINLKIERKRYEKQKLERKFEKLNDEIKELKQTLEFQNKLLEINNNELPKINEQNKLITTYIG